MALRIEVRDLLAFLCGDFLGGFLLNSIPR